MAFVRECMEEKRNENVGERSPVAEMLPQK